MRRSDPRSSGLAPTEVVNLFGVPVENCTMAEALGRLEGFVLGPGDRPRTAFFVNAHTLNLAYESPDYRQVLCSADQVFGDGTGVRWAARLVHGVRMADNVNGTDLVPAFLGGQAGRGLRYFLLGTRPDAIGRTADYAAEAFPNWTLAGFHHGYVVPEASEDLIEAINTARPELLLVGMGNPKQEAWIAENLGRLRVALVIGVGGLFDYWAGDLDRAARWVRRFGLEWVHLLVRQPRKARRYLLGNPLFLWRLLVERRAVRRAGCVSIR
jgi:N-acetylglucosaminyldiphosphoundecaprenol N-acetyl-beta-D-mannosaminyltransferase